MNRVACIAGLCLIATAGTLLSPPTWAAPAASRELVIADSWSGTVTLPGNAKLDFSVVLTADGGTIDIPMQGAAGLALNEVSQTDKEVRFTLKPPGAPEAGWARFEATIEADGESAKGILKQGGGHFPLTMKKAKPGEKAKTINRPQEPKAPFPYEARDVEYVNELDGTKLAGTLTYPSAGGKSPAVVLITGSGSQDRNEALMGHKPFLVLADHLTRAGFVVLRVDDRGVGGSSGSVSKSTSDDFAGDALAGVKFLAAQPEVDPKNIGLIGHSEGGLIAPMAAARSDDVAFIVLMAGTGLPGRDILSLQSELISRANGEKEAFIQQEKEFDRQIIDVIASGASLDVVKAKMREVGEKQIELGEKSEDPKDREKAADAKKSLDSLVEQQSKQMTSPWFRYFLTLDPRVALRKVKCPVLAINGERDLQVPPKENLAEIAKALREGGNSKLTTKELTGLNHLFQHCTTGSPSEYGEIEETFAPEALDAITAWLREQTGLASR